MADYTTTAEVKTYLRITSSADDTLIGTLVTRASALIDDACGRWFTAQTATRKYDAVGNHITGRLLLVDADLLTVSTLTNGDGSNIATSDIILRPINWPPYFGIALKASSNLNWTYQTDPAGAISVTGTWGYAATPPAAIAQASVRLAAWLYRQRDTGAELSAEPLISERGTVRPPSRLPRDVEDMISPFVRLKISG
jgi:hypothetical protein